MDDDADTCGFTEEELEENCVFCEKYGVFVQIIWGYSQIVHKFENYPLTNQEKERIIMLPAKVLVNFLAFLWKEDGRYEILSDQKRGVLS